MFVVIVDMSLLLGPDEPSKTIYGPFKTMELASDWAEAKCTPSKDSEDRTDVDYARFVIVQLFDPKSTKNIWE